MVVVRMSVGIAISLTGVNRVFVRAKKRVDQTREDKLSVFTSGPI